MKLSLVLVLLLVVAILLDPSDCWRRRRRRRRRGGRWSLSNGGVTYTFGNGHSLTGHGSLSNGGSFGLSYTIPLGRKRRSIGDQQQPDVSKVADSTPESLTPKPLSFNTEADAEKSELQDQQQQPAVPEEKIDEFRPTQDQESDDSCNECLDVQPFKLNDKVVENKTLTNNDFVMVVKLMEENMSVLKLNAKIKFEVTDVVKSPLESVKAGQTFTIKAELAKCQCLTSLDPGYYVVTGMVNDQNQLILSNVLMEFEE